MQDLQQNFHTHSAHLLIVALIVDVKKVHKLIAVVMMSVGSRSNTRSVL